MDRGRLFDSYNAGYVQALYEEYLRAPASVDAEWRRLFESGALAGYGIIPAPGVVAAVPVAPVGAPAVAVAVPVPGAPAAAPGLSERQLRVAFAAAALADAYRTHGRLAARLDPLGSEPEIPPSLRPETYGITPEELSTVPARLLGMERAGETMADVVEWLKATYTGTIGYEVEHVAAPERRAWLRERIESGSHREPLHREEQIRLLERLTDVEAFEQFLHRAYLGQKRFSLEGTDMMVPMLDHAMERAAAAGAEEVVIGMAHRGRLNMLVHALGRPYERIIAEFEGVQGADGSTGDVKYHLGAEGGYRTRSGREIGVRMAPNPSHLEYVDPVVEGIARARQTDRARPQSRRDEDLVLPVLIHGDAAFAGQGVVAETLNLAELDGYRTGGTLHLIANNQIGFTTGPHDARSTRFASDLAKGFDIPIFHVNADDAEACLAVMRLAADFRERFHADVVIDLVGYRRYGHNEGDEPAYTQPVLYARIAEHPTVRAIWAERLVAAGVVTAEEAEAMRERAHERLVEAQRKVREAIESQASAGPLPVEAESLEAPVDTAVDAARLVALDRALHRWPESFTVNPKLARQLARRAQALEQDGPIDWAHAEALALGTLLQDGVPVRMTGQDTERGTFSQRHLVLHDVKTGERWCALGALEDAQGSFELHNSPLSEMAALGFEYGYSVASPGALVIWEAQFGDFANGAQVIIDQFLSAGRAKWGQASRLTLLLPHGYEGQGPEHSSARIERFLQLAAEDNLRVVNATTPAQYFHLLRRQARLEERRPLVVFTPKSLLRHPRAVSRLRDLAGGRFELVIDDAAARERADEVRRIVLCAGKVYYDLIGSEQRDGAGAVAVARLEQLYPFPEAELAALLGSYPNAEELVWVQEEPLNMGAWRYLEPRLRPLAAAHLQLASIGRPDRAAPAEGYAAMHQRQQAVIVEQALGSPARRRRKARTA